jgi:hypothetical protein
VASCADCAAAIGAHRRLLAMAREESTVPSVPLTRWETLAPLLAQAGLLAQRESSAQLSAVQPTWPAHAARSAALSWPARIAAALVFTVGGTIIGRYTAMPHGLAEAGVAGVPTVANRDDSMPIFHSAAEALATLNRAELEYRHATAYLVAQEPDTTTTDLRDSYRARLQALDEVAQTTRAALQEAPNDPVLNEYYLSTVGARSATLRQLNGALPVGMKLERY